MRLVETLSEWFDDFLLSLQRRGYSAKTNHNYLHAFRLFLEWVAARPELIRPGDVTTAVLELYQNHMMLRRSRIQAQGKPPRVLSASTRNNHTTVLRGFFRFLRKRDLILVNPAADLEYARKPARVPKRVLSVPEMLRLLDTPSLSSPLGLRDRAAMELLYSTAVRRNELLSLSPKELDFEENSLRVIGKGDRERIVPIGLTAQRTLKRYLEEVRPLWATGQCGKLFLNPNGGPLSAKVLARRICKYGKLAGIKKPLSLHLFRHSCATHLLQGGADLRSIQLLLGHNQLSTTAIYTHLNLGYLRDILRKFHPREND